MTLLHKLFQKKQQTDLDRARRKVISDLEETIRMCNQTKEINEKATNQLLNNLAKINL